MDTLLLNSGVGLAVECQFRLSHDDDKKAHHADLIWFRGAFRAKKSSEAQQEIGKWINSAENLLLTAVEEMFMMYNKMFHLLVEFKLLTSFDLKFKVF